MAVLQSKLYGIGCAVHDRGSVVSGLLHVQRNLVLHLVRSSGRRISRSNNALTHPDAPAATSCAMPCEAQSIPPELSFTFPRAPAWSMQGQREQTRQQLSFNLLQLGCIRGTITSATFRAMPLQVSKACSHRGTLTCCEFEKHHSAFMRSRLFVIGSSDFSSSGKSENPGQETEKFMRSQINARSPCEPAA